MMMMMKWEEEGVEKGDENEGEEEAEGGKVETTAKENPWKNYYPFDRLSRETLECLHQIRH